MAIQELHPLKLGEGGGHVYVSSVVRSTSVLETLQIFIKSFKTKLLRPSQAFPSETITEADNECVVNIPSINDIFPMRIGLNRDRITNVLYIFREPLEVIFFQIVLFILCLK